MLNSLMTYYYHLFHKIKNIYVIIVEKVILECLKPSTTTCLVTNITRAFTQFSYVPASFTSLLSVNTV